MTTVAIIQARMGSTRLPGKVMMGVAGHPLLYHVVKRLQTAKKLDLVVVATTTNPADEIIISYCAAHSVTCFRGSEEDVLDRYYQAALKYDADTIVRITADCPLLDPEVVDDMITMFEIGDYDYVSNTLTPTFPDGLDVEVFGMPILREASHDAQRLSEREHVTPFINKQPDRFHLGNYKSDRDLSHLRWTVDEPCDLEFVRAVYDQLGDRLFGIAEILRLLEAQPELANLNADITRNEGYLKSLFEDRINL